MFRDTFKITKDDTTGVPVKFTILNITQYVIIYLGAFYYLNWGNILHLYVFTSKILLTFSVKIVYCQVYYYCWHFKFNFSKDYLSADLIKIYFVRDALVFTFDIFLYVSYLFSYNKSTLYKQLIHLQHLKALITKLAIPVNCSAQ